MAVTETGAESVAETVTGAVTVTESVTVTVTEAVCCVDCAQGFGDFKKY